MIKTLLAAVDGSNHALKAVDFAGELAKQCGARLVLVTVIREAPLLDSLGEFEHRDRTQGPPEDMLRKEAEHILAGAARVADALGVSDVITRVDVGQPARMIVRAAQDLGVDMIVLGGRGRGSAEDVLTGGVTQRVLLMAGCPVLTVKGAFDPAARRYGEGPPR